jgi:hypothetical protein
MNGVPLKFKKKNEQASSLPARITVFDLVLIPRRIHSTIPLNVHLHEIFCAGVLWAN